MSLAHDKDHQNENIKTAKMRKCSWKYDRNLVFDKCPLFLRKTHVMIENCDPDIAEWSSEGDSFVIKDSQAFATTVIPKFFKHNNFSSYVRQLNLHGFRKIKLVDTSSEQLESNYWRFQLHNFVRGRPDLLAGLRKPNKDGSSTQKDIEILRSDVDDLKRSMSSLSSDLKFFGSVIKKMNTIVESKIMGHQSKKQKISQSSYKSGHYSSIKSDGHNSVLELLKPSKMGSTRSSPMAVTVVSPDQGIPNNNKDYENQDKDRVLCDLLSKYLGCSVSKNYKDNSNVSTISSMAAESNQSSAMSGSSVSDSNDDESYLDDAMEISPLPYKVEYQCPEQFMGEVVAEQQPSSDHKFKTPPQSQKRDSTIILDHHKLQSSEEKNVLMQSQGVKNSQHARFGKGTMFSTGQLPLPTADEKRKRKQKKFFSQAA